MKSKLLPVLLFLPLFWIGINNSHDWGDDYAQYLLQARNLIEGRAQTNNDLVFAEGQLPYAIIAYPVGFPILLAPVYSFYQLNIPPFLILNSVFLLLTSLLLFDYLKRTFDIRTSLLIALFFSYNIISILLKSEILSEFPFTFVLLTIIYLLKTDHRKSFLWAGILGGILISIRISGLVLFPAILFWLLIMQRQMSIQKRVLDFGIFFSLAVAVFLLLNTLLFNIEISNFFSFYAGQFESNRMMVPSNFFAFFEKFSAVFLPNFKSVLITIPVVTIIVAGFFNKMRERQPSEWLFIFYLFLIAFYPYSSSGLRFIYPVLPFILIYFVKGFQIIYRFIFSNDRSFTVLTIIMCCSIIISIKVLNSLPKPDGPYSSDARSVLSYIRKEIPEDAIVLFSRARAMNLYGERKSTFLIQNKNEEQNFSILKKLNCNYILYADERSGAFNQSLQDFLIVNQTEFDTIYKVDRYLLLKMKVPSLQ